MPTIADIQKLIKQPADNTWSPQDQAALIKAERDTKRQVQKLLGVLVDGLWMGKSQAALQALIDAQEGWISCKASSFADPADLVGFRNCKKKGHSDLFCFNYGDNGIGQFGDITAQTVTPYVAIHRSYMISRWGSVLASAHREVFVCINNSVQRIKVGDRISAKGRIDLNPAAYGLWKLTAPLMIDAKWKWA